MVNVRENGLSPTMLGDGRHVTQACNKCGWNAERREPWREIALTKTTEHHTKLGSALVVHGFRWPQAGRRFDYRAECN